MIVTKLLYLSFRRSLQAHYRNQIQLENQVLLKCNHRDRLHNTLKRLLVFTDSPKSRKGIRANRLPRDQSLSVLHSSKENLKWTDLCFLFLYLTIRMEEEIGHEQHSIRSLLSAIWLYSCSFGKIVCPNVGFTVLEHNLT